MLDGLDGLIAALSLILWGAHAVVPWRLACPPADTPADTPAGAGRRRWGRAALPLLALGAALALAWVARHPDAAIAARLVPLTASTPGRALAIVLPVLAVVDLVLLAGWRRLEDVGWRLAAGLGLAFAAVASLAAEVLRVGEGPTSPPSVLLAAAGCRALVALGAGEVLAPGQGRPWAALGAGLALPLWLWLLPLDLAQAVAAEGTLLTLGAAAVLFLGAPWLPPALRRPALAGAALLAGLVFAGAAELSQGLAMQVPPATLQ